MIIEEGIIGEYAYLIREVPMMGCLCGYLGIPQQLIDVIDPDNIRVHGGVTYQALVEENCSLFDDAQTYPFKIFWIGFDCAHYMDLVPGIPSTAYNGIYRDRDYVFNEIEKMANQVSSFIRDNLVLEGNSDRYLLESPEETENS